MKFWWCNKIVIKYTDYNKIDSPFHFQFGKMENMPEIQQMMKGMGGSR